MDDNNEDRPIPGSEAKILLMIRRWDWGYPIFSDDDPDMSPINDTKVVKSTIPIPEQEEED